jgi:hypothetical protein
MPIMRLRRARASRFLYSSSFWARAAARCSLTLSAWNAQLQVDGVDDERIGEFLEEFWKSQFVPEPGALCSGALDAPGKVS